MKEIFWDQSKAHFFVRKELGHHLGTNILGRTIFLGGKVEFWEK